MYHKECHRAYHRWWCVEGGGALVGRAAEMGWCVWKRVYLPQRL